MANSSNYECIPCKFESNNRKDYKRHSSTIKHAKRLREYANAQSGAPCIDPEYDDKFTCYCGLIYKSRSGLWRHEQTCVQVSFDKNSPPSDASHSGQTTGQIHSEIELLKLKIEQDKIVLEQQRIKQQSDMNVMVEKIENQSRDALGVMATISKQQSTTVTDALDTMATLVCSAMGKMNTVTNISTTTNNFNLNVFLTDTCKDAMNIMDFVASLKYGIEDITRVGRVGYAEAVSSLMIEGLRGLDVTKRPIHCTDAKRERIYVKHDNEWLDRDDPESKLKSAIKIVGHRNLCTLEKWKETHPEFEKHPSRHHAAYLEICNNSMGGLVDDGDVQYKKIMKRLAPKIVIVKDEHV